MDGIIVAVLVAVGVLASLFDIMERRVPNWLVFPVMATGITYHQLIGGWKGAGLAVEGAAVGAAILLGPYVFGAVGAGDVKLLMAFGALAGPENILRGSFAGIVLGGVGALVALAVRGRLFQALQGIGVWAVLSTSGVKTPLPVDRTHTLPYGVFLTLGMLISLWGWAA